MQIDKYKIFMFDCDGVLLDSNDVKVEAFYRAIKHHGEDAAKELAVYHKNNGGISRFKKFHYFFREILGRKDDYSKDYDEAMEKFGEVSYAGMLNAPETNGVRDFIEKLPADSKKYVISGTKEDELLEVFAKRGFDNLFNGVYGSPATKEDIFSKIIKSDMDKSRIVYFGDAKKDYLVAMEFGIDFVFMSGYTGFEEWESFFEGKEATIIKDFSEI